LGVLISVQERSVVEGGTIHVTFLRLQGEDLDETFTLRFQDVNGHTAGNILTFSAPGESEPVKAIVIQLDPG
jgi:hypothetical protein